ncbi:MAG: Methanol oxidation glmU-like protein [Myxococcales bacterium]|nr:Methanol oxidation glmU-like protein [Myxococcales bacterium]
MIEAQWKVLPHGPIETLGDRLRVVEGALPNMPLKRVMSVLRMDDGGLLIHGGVALNPAVMADLEAWGPPKILLVPNGWHRSDAPAFKRRYPELKIYCPAGARARVEKAVTVDGTYAELPSTAPVTIRYLDGVGEREGYLELRQGGRVTLIFNDAIFNQQHLPGLFGVIYRLIGSSGGPRVTGLLKLAMVRDKNALKSQLERLADTPDLERIVIMHGTRVEDAPGEFLRQVAATL